MNFKLMMCSVCFALASGLVYGQYSEWSSVPADYVPGGTIRVTEAPGRPVAGVTFFSNRADFYSAAPGLTVEAFGSSITAANSVCNDTPPLSSATNDGCYAAGDLLPGYDLDINSNGGTGEYVLLTTGFLGLSTDSVGPNSFSDDMELNFPAGVGAVGFDIVSPNANSVVDVHIYSGATLLTSTSVTADLDGTFFGITSSDQVTRIELVEQVDNGELIQNLAFGEATAVPAMGMGGMIILFTLLIGTAVFMMRRKAA